MATVRDGGVATVREGVTGDGHSDGWGSGHIGEGEWPQ